MEYGLLIGEFTLLRAWDCGLDLFELEDEGFEILLEVS